MVHSHIYREIRRNGFNCNKVFLRAAQIDALERLHFRIRLEDMCDSPEMLICIDETARANIDGLRDHAWARCGNRGRAAIFQVFDTTKMQYSMIAAADINGFITETRCVVMREKGIIDRDPTRGTIGKQRFKLWLKEDLIPTLGFYALKEPRSLVLIDNATIHHDDAIVQMIRDAGAEIIFLSPYSPDYNPNDFFLYLQENAKKTTEHSLV